MSVAAVEHEHRVSPRELFFDLVFVFAFTQVVTLLAGDPTFAGIGRGVLVLAALWWAWVSYTSLTNTVNPDDQMVGGVAQLAALMATFVAALAVPDVFDDEGALFGAAFLVVCALHIALYAFAVRGNRDQLRAVLRLAPWSLLGAMLILIAGFTDGARTWLWLAALACFYLGAALSGSTGWQLHPSHLAERYGLVLIIALGEPSSRSGSASQGPVSARERSRPPSSGCSLLPQSGLPTSTSSRSAASGSSRSSGAPTRWPSPETCTYTRISR
jgi:low temperature requirement protein LtrA